MTLSGTTHTLEDAKQLCLLDYDCGGIYDEGCNGGCDFDSRDYDMETYSSYYEGIFTCDGGWQLCSQSKLDAASSAYPPDGYRVSQNSCVYKLTRPLSALARERLDRSGWTASHRMTWTG
jgi:hypothetical protein